MDGGVRDMPDANPGGETRFRKGIPEKARLGTAFALPSLNRGFQIYLMAEERARAFLISLAA
jgi:hypothetical protein